MTAQLIPFAGHPALHPEDRRRAREIRGELEGDALRLAQEWCDACGYTMADMTGRRKYQALVEARQGLMWVLHRRAGLSYAAIGRALDRDHTTVMDGVAAESRRREK